MFLNYCVTLPGVSKEDEVGAINRQKRGVFGGSNPFSAARDRKATRVKLFDPFRFGSSDRFSHGFGKRHISSNSVNVSVGLLFLHFYVSIYSFIYSRIHSFIYSFIHTFI